MLSGRSWSSPPKVSSLGVGDRSGRRGACLGMDSRWRRSSSNAWALDNLLDLPDSFLSLSGSLDLERRRKLRDELLLLVCSLELALLYSVIGGRPSEPRPGVEVRDDAVAILEVAVVRGRALSNWAGRVGGKVRAVKRVAVFNYSLSLGDSDDGG